MSPRLQQVLDEIAQLTPEERSQLIEQVQQMQTPEMQPKKSWQDLEGIAPNLLNGEDAQTWVNQLRDEWDERDRQIQNLSQEAEKPWMKFAGVFKNDSDFAAIVKALREEREIDDSSAYSLDDIEAI